MEKKDLIDAAGRLKKCLVEVDRVIDSLQQPESEKMNVSATNHNFDFAKIRDEISAIKEGGGFPDEDIQRFRIWNESLERFEYSGGTPMMLSQFFRHTAPMNTSGGYRYERATGLWDIHGRPIYENDIVKWGHMMGGIETPVRIAQVMMNPAVTFVCMNIDLEIGYGRFAYPDTSKYLEVIGTIHDEKNYAAE